MKDFIVTCKMCGHIAAVSAENAESAKCPLCGFTHEDFPCSITVQGLEQAGTATIELVDDVPGAVIEPEEIPEEDYEDFTL